MKLETRMLFYDQVHMDVYRTDDQHIVETVVFAGTNYHKTLLSLTNQIGCSVRCDFCYGNNFPYARNITADEFLQQVSGALEENSLVPWFDPERPVKVGFQRAGEALLNKHFYDGFERIAETYHPSFQLTTILPSSDISLRMLSQVREYLTRYLETFQINISMHTTDEEKRKQMMSRFNHLMTFKDIAKFGEEWVRTIRKRRIDLSFVLMEDNEVDFRKIRETFDPRFFSIRFASYLPSSEETARLHIPSSHERMHRKAKEARELGYHCVQSHAGPVEGIWDTRPFSALKLLRKS
jgi:adenine C2-methylase RlmN of 23S rRNA A2503 and tRNA A37